MPSRRTALLIALICLGALAWQAAHVYLLYDGHWSGLFCIGEGAPLPPALDSSYRHEGSRGYDGRYYRIVAYDPLLQGDYWRYLDSPQYRYRRILFPLAACMLAFGQPRLVDAAYAGLQILLLGCCLWLAVRMWGSGGFGFALMPGVLIGIDWMTVDIALYAAWLAALAAWKEERPVWMAAALALGCLARDTGVLVCAAFVAWAVWNRRWPWAFLSCAAALPAMAWSAWVNSRIPAPSMTANSITPQWAFHHSVTGILDCLRHPVPYNLGPIPTLVTQLADGTAWLGMLLAVVLGFLLLRRFPGRVESWISAAFAALFFVTGAPEFWRDFLSWPRAYTPLFCVLAAYGLERRLWVWLAPMAAVSLRIGGMMAVDWAPVLRRLFD